MLTDEQMRAIAGTLKRIVTDDEVKAAWGMQQRELVKRQLERGERATGYRADWVRNGRDAVLEALGNVIKEFNAKYKHDVITLADMMDVLLSASAKIEAAAERAVTEQTQDDA